MRESGLSTLLASGPNRLPRLLYDRLAVQLSSEVCSKSIAVCEAQNTTGEAPPDNRYLAIVPLIEFIEAPNHPLANPALRTQIPTLLPTMRRKATIFQEAAEKDSRCIVSHEACQYENGLASPRGACRRKGDAGPRVIPSRTARCPSRRKSPMEGDPVFAILLILRSAWATELSPSAGAPERSGEDLRIGRRNRCAGASYSR